MTFQDLLGEALNAIDTDLVVTIAVFTPDKKVLIATRKAEPEAGKWALPGGHVGEGESPLRAALRELKEETGITPDKMSYVATKPIDGPRGSKDVLYACVVKDEYARAGSDAGKIAWVPIRELPQLAFDHNDFVLIALKHLFGVKALQNEMTSRLRANVIIEDKDKHTLTHRPTKGCLMVFCGVDGAGKTTQSEKLIKTLEDEGYDAVYTKWNSSELIKPAISKAKDDRILTPLLFSLLHASDLILRYEEDIMPALDEDKVVVCDRYIYTSYVRDGIRGVNTQILEDLYENFREPDILFYCKVPIGVALARVKQDKGFSFYSAGMDLDLADKKGASARKYLEMMDKRYNEILPKIGGYHELNMDRSIGDIAKEVWEVVEKKLG